MRISIDFNGFSITKEEAQPIFDICNKQNTLKDSELLNEISFTVDRIDKKIDALIQNLIKSDLTIHITK